MISREEQIDAMTDDLDMFHANNPGGGMRGYARFASAQEIAAKHILEAERRAEQRVRAEIARDIKKACETVMGIETPMMRGDNLAVTLCSYFEDIEGEPDDNGWHPKAIEGHDQVKSGIEQHFLKAIDAAREAQG